MGESVAACGWYPDPEHEGFSRYWEGERWTDYRHPHTSQAPPGLYPDPTGQSHWRHWTGQGWEHLATPASTDAGDGLARDELLSLVRTLTEIQENWEAGLRQAREGLTETARASKRRIESAVRNVERLSQDRVVDRYLWKVVLYNTALKMPDGTYELTPDVTAWVEETGMVQRVQGWVFKSDHDRREAYLHVEGAHWSSVFRIDFKWSPISSNTGGLRRLAQNITTTARHSSTAREEKGQQVIAATNELLSLLEEQSALLNGTVDEFERARHTATREVSQQQETVRDALARVRDPKPIKAAIKVLHKADSFIEAAGSSRAVPAPALAALEYFQDVRQGITDSAIGYNGRAEDESDLAEGHDIFEPQTSGPEELGADEDSSPRAGETDREEAPKASSPGEALTLLRELGSLRDAGFVTAEEFEEKKTDLLRRL